MPRETSSVFDRLSLPGVDVPKKSDLVEEGSVSIKDTDKSKSELCSKWMRNKTNHYASRPKIPPVLGHQTVGRVEPLFGEPGKNPQRIRSCAFKSTTKYGYQDYRRNSSHGKRRQMAPRILFSGDVGLKTKGKRMSSRRPQSKDGWKNRRTNGDRECLEVGPTRGFPPEGSVLARYWYQFEWPPERRQTHVDCISSAGIWLMDFPPEGSVLARYWNQFKWPLKRRQNQEYCSQDAKSMGQ